MATDKPSPVEEIKTKSRALRGSIAEELQNPEPAFAKDTTQLLKFHGMYQQDDRDRRKGGEKFHSLMLRGRIPGGRLSAEQYLIWEHLADEYANGTIRLTTRQSIQLHGILKASMKTVIQAIRSINQTTEGACGDVVRNITQSINPAGRPELDLLDPVAEHLSDHFKAASNAYVEIWLDGEQVKNPDDEKDDIYGDVYLPRKFKCAITIAGENAIDLYTNDLAFAATLNQGQIEGYFVFAGGGLGKTHRKPETFPRLADLLGWIPAEKLTAVAEAIVTIHRDFGNRSNRKQARLKYVFAEKGLDWAKNEVEKRADVKLEDRPLPEWQVPEYHGWLKRTDGTYSLGLPILSGRISDSDQKWKSAIRKVVKAVQPAIQITADQDLILMGIEENQCSEVEAIFTEHNVKLNSDPLYKRALACPALPTCGLAITEAERYLPDLLPLIDEALQNHGMNDAPAPVFRMTGCPNGCARPYSAELALVGRSLNTYALYVGGNPEGSRLATELSDTVKSEDFPRVFGNLFSLWKQERQHAGESFGNTMSRLPVEELQKRAFV